MIISNFVVFPVHWMINTKQSKPPSLYMSGIITVAVSMTMINEQQKKEDRLSFANLKLSCSLCLHRGHSKNKFYG